MQYRVERQSRLLVGASYYGYIGNEYAGFATGSICNGVFDIDNTHLEGRFRGAKSVRAFQQIIKAIHKDHDVIRSRIDSKDNDEIKIVLSAGFHIIGTVSYDGEVTIELIKTKET